MDYLLEPGRVCYEGRVGLVLGSHVCSSIRWSGLLVASSLVFHRGTREWARATQASLVSTHLLECLHSLKLLHPYKSRLSFSSFPTFPPAITYSSPFPNFHSRNLSDRYQPTIAFLFFKHDLDIHFGKKPFHKEHCLLPPIPLFP